MVGELSGDYNVGLWAICAGVLRRAELLERAAEAPASPPPSALVQEAFDLVSHILLPEPILQLTGYHVVIY